MFMEIAFLIKVKSEVSRNFESITIMIHNLNEIRLQFIDVLNLSLQW